MDACALMAVIVKEPERDFIIQLTQDAELVCPNMIPYEISNALTKMMKKNVIDKQRMLNAFKYFQNIPFKTIKIDFEKALEIAWEYKIYAYDACYLETAKRLNIPLLTFDNSMIKVGKKLGINVIGEKNVGI